MSRASASVDSFWAWKERRGNAVRQVFSGNGGALPITPSESLSLSEGGPSEASGLSRGLAKLGKTLLIGGAAAVGVYAVGAAVSSYTARRGLVPEGKLRFQCPHCHGKYDVSIAALREGADFVRCPLDHIKFPMEDVLNRYRVRI